MDTIIGSIVITVTVLALVILATGGFTLTSFAIITVAAMLAGVAAYLIGDKVR